MADDTATPASPSPPPREPHPRPSSPPSSSSSSSRPSSPPATTTRSASHKPPPPPAQAPPAPAAPPPPHHPAYHHARDLTHYLEATFVPSVVPQPDEYQAKELARQYLEKLAAQVSPGAKLLPFGSMANGFALKNSDMDLCCFLAKDAPVRAPAELVELLGRLIEQETNFYVKMLPRARIPIIKLTMPATPACPAGVACDIGFENRLALENTRLLLTYAMVDSRLRTLVLFLKVWTKRRKINNPYRGTLSSYGYVLLVIHFLAHVKQPPVLPNLQRLPLPDATPLDDLTYDGHDIAFFDDVDALPSVFQTLNTDSAGELLIDFFRYWSKEFNYAHQVVSIRSDKGTVQKVAKGWHTDFEFDPELIVRDQHKLCIEDPFQLDYNVARTVTRDGLYTIRGEFMRAFRILTTPPRAATSTSAEENVGTLIGALCDEREDYLLIHPADAAAADLHAPSAYGHAHGHHYGVPPAHHHGAYAPPHQQHYPHRGGPPGSPSPSSSSTATPSTSTPSTAAAAASAGPKSPRRRSAPSPRLASAQGSPHQQHAQHSHPHPHPHQHPHQQQHSLHPHSYHPQHPPPLWAAANGATVHLSSAPGTGAATARKERTASASGERDEGKEGAPQGQQTLGEAFVPRGPAASGAAQGGAGGAGGGHERRSSWNGAPAGLGAGSRGAGDASSSSAAGKQGGAGVDLHRFFQGGSSAGAEASAAAAGGPAISSSQSDAGGPSASSSSSSSGSAAPVAASTVHGGHALPPPRTAVSLTAPSSPDLAASSAYFAGHPPAPSSAYGSSSGAYGRGYGASAGGARGYGGSHVGPRLQSLPRQLPGHQQQQQQQQQHLGHSQQHHLGSQAQHASPAYPNPYAAPPTPLPFSATAPPNPPPLGGSASLGLGFNGLAGLSAHPHSHAHAHSLAAYHPFQQHAHHSPHASSSSSTLVSPAALHATTPSASTSAPRPIFPAEDRETIARSSHIAFGSFPEMLPLPSYAHYHASGGSAAYLAGAGGWGSVPYGVVPTSTKRATPGEGGGGPRGRGTRLGSTREADADEDDADAEVDALDLDLDDDDEERSRGRSGEGLDDEAARSASAAKRLRGRSAPHIRTGPDGRETLLIGDIEVTLPRPEDVEEAELEDDEERDDEVERGPSEGEDVDVEREERSETPSTSSGAGEQLDAAAVDEADVEPATGETGAVVGALEPLLSSSSSTSSPPSPPPPSAPHHNLPTLTTQPPTPAKPSRPLRPESSDLDLDDEPRDLPRANGRAPTSSSSSSSSSTPSSPPMPPQAQILTNGVEALHLEDAAAAAESHA
ncbi:hypothetical protein JCM9279_000927 [Rhodotorula babjevae]